jgi:hypothetical protein
MLFAQIGQGPDPGSAVVQAGDVVELLAAGMQEGLARLLRNLLQRLQTIGC